MTSGSTPRISTRKQPKQARSKQLVGEILSAAGRVLARDGARRFTAARVAEEAGVSVGSLYQYFPNKEAILFRLQTDEWSSRSSGPNVKRPKCASHWTMRRHSIAMHRKRARFA